jgi:peptide/nickel transport system permease protein
MIVFVGVYMIGDPVELFTNPSMSQEDVAEVRENLGFDKPLWQQYLLFLQRLLGGDLGLSYIFGTSAFDVIMQRLPATLELACGAILVSLAVGIPVGLIAGLRQHSLIDRAVMVLSSFCFSVPSFWAGLLLIMFFSVKLGWMPTGGRGPTREIFGIGFSFLTLQGLQMMILPVINLALPVLALIARLTRAGTIEHMRLDYIRCAEAKGVPRRRLIGVHLLRNIIIPVVTIAGLQLGNLIAFAVVTESIFSWPGVGKLIIDSIIHLDRPVIVAQLIVVVFIFGMINLAVDILNALLDPRVRSSVGAS